MGNASGKQEMWPRRDFVWLVAFVIWTGILLFSRVVWNDEAVIKAIDVSGIVSAIVLAVVTIVYTMSDSGAQKRVVAELGTNAKNLGDKLDQLTTVVAQLQTGVTSVQGISADLKEVTKVFEAVQSMSEQIAQVQNSVADLVKSAREHEGKVNVEQLEKLEKQINMTSISGSAMARSSASGRLSVNQVLKHSKIFVIEYKILAAFSEVIGANVEVVIQRAVFEYASGRVSVVPIAYSEDTCTLRLDVVVQTKQLVTSEGLKALLAVYDSSDFEVLSVYER